MNAPLKKALNNRSKQKVSAIEQITKMSVRKEYARRKKVGDHGNE